MLVGLLMKVRSLSIRSLVLVTCLGLTALALADVKITAKVTVTGGAGDKSGTQMVTTCYKGSLIRTETEKVISIYDSKTQTITTMRKSDKTYRVLSLKEGLTKMPSMLAKLNVTSSADVKPQPEKSVIAGKPAKKYIGSATIHISPEGAKEDTFPTTHIEVEQWMTEAVKFSADGGTTPSPLEQLLGPLSIYGGMEPVINAFATMKGVPLSSVVTVTVTGGKSPQHDPIVTTTEVQSMKDGQLDASLFAVPKGYTQMTLRKPQLPNKKAP